MFHESRLVDVTGTQSFVKFDCNAPRMHWFIGEEWLNAKEIYHDVEVELTYKTISDKSDF